MIQKKLFADNGAIFSPCRVWRYVLWRTWDKERKHVAFIGLNPSTADEENDDPTVRRCIRFAQKWGYGGMYMLNIFAFRATDPKVMKAAKYPIGEENDYYLKIYHDKSVLTVACWGIHGAFMSRGKQVSQTLHGIKCFGIVKNGEPKHPLYLRSDSELEVYNGPY